MNTQLPMHIALYDDKPQTMTREKGLTLWKACAFMRIPCRYWQVGDEGWQTMTDEIARNLRRSGIKSEAEKRAVAELLCYKAETRAEALTQNLPFKVSVDTGNEDSEPSLLIDNVSITPEIVSGFGRVCAKWYVMSIDEDDEQEEFNSLDMAIIAAAKRACHKNMATLAYQSTRT